MSFDTSQRSHRDLRSVIAEKTNKLVLWLGSGLSASAGLPTWAQLKDGLVKELQDKATTLDVNAATRHREAARYATDTANQWTAFDVLQKHLGNTSYRAIIRAALAPAATLPCPELYRRIWQLRPAGILNLNLDRLATRALVELTQGRRTPHEFSGRHAGQYLHLLKSPHPYVANLHGTAEDVSSWVFTRPELTRLLKARGYNTLIGSCLTTTTVLFVGIQADDIAAGGQLEALTRSQVDAGSHYWLTNRSDHTTDKWAEQAGLRVIRYRDARKHAELTEFFDDVLQFVPRDSEDYSRPVVPTTSSTSTNAALPDPQALVHEPAEVIRKALNAEAKELLSPGLPESYTAYERFAAKYDEVIYRAWYTAPGTKLLGFTLNEEAGKGAFGRVYRANAPDGREVAIKVLLEEVRRSPQLLGSFRRGVRSMQYLGERGVSGMVTYQEASEIPAFVVMDWIDGPTLTEAVQARYLDDWDSILKVAYEMTDVIRRAHAIPERVLHRDVRPSNVMFDRYYNRRDDWRVVVLDFDLSWHMGALEKSIVYGSLTGYLAPEQIELIPGCSTRHAAVDSFGVGMTLYYMISGVDPVPEQHKHHDWATTVYTAAIQRPGARWLSLPRRYARVIIRATNDSQAERWDMTQIHDELARLHTAESSPSEIVSAELIAEEIAAGLHREYEWNDDQALAHIRLTSGADIRVRGDESKRRIVLNLHWSAGGRQEWKQVAKWIGPAADRCTKTLRKAGWVIDEKNIHGRESMAIEAAIRARRAAAEREVQVEAVRRVIEELSFE